MEKEKKKVGIGTLVWLLIIACVLTAAVCNFVLKTIISVVVQIVILRQRNRR